MNFSGEAESGRELECALVPVDAVGMRLDAFLASVSELSRSGAVRLIEGGAVFVNRRAAENKKTALREGDLVEWLMPEPEAPEALPEEIPLDILYEDDDLLVINKPKGMVVHPAPGNPNGTLVNALLWHCRGSLSGVGGVIRPGIVHRIDKDTSGLLVVAKNDRSHIALSEQLKGHHINRIYTAIAVGNFREDSGVVDAPIGRNPNDRKKMAVIRNAGIPSRDAVTHWTVLSRGSAGGNAFTLLRCELETGRTHQIRVHLASLGHPILGDPLYGGDNTAFQKKRREEIRGQCLHAGEIHFVHPTTGREMTFTCPLPPEVESIRQELFGSEPTERT